MRGGEGAGMTTCVHPTACATPTHARLALSLVQGGPHNHTISGLACALKQAAGSEFKAYQEQVGQGGGREGGRCME